MLVIIPNVAISTCRPRILNHTAIKRQGRGTLEVDVYGNIILMKLRISDEMVS